MKRFLGRTEWPSDLGLPLAFVKGEVCGQVLRDRSELPELFGFMEFEIFYTFLNHLAMARNKCAMEGRVLKHSDILTYEEFKHSFYNTKNPSDLGIEKK